MKTWRWQYEKRLARKLGRARLVILVWLLPVGCAVGDPVALDYYSGTEKIAGGHPPTVPIVTYTAAARRFDFTESTDPDTGGEVANYIVYFYSGVPVKYYESRFIEAIIPAGSAKTFFVSGAPGTYTVIVTGYDGYRESAVTEHNRIIFSLP